MEASSCKRSGQYLRATVGKEAGVARSIANSVEDTGLLGIELQLQHLLDCSQLSMTSFSEGLEVGVVDAELAKGLTWIAGGLHELQVGDRKQLSGPGGLAEQTGEELR